MSDDKLKVDEHDEAGSETPESGNGQSTPTKNLPPALALGFVIIALLGVIIVMVLRNGALVSSVSESDIAQVQSEVDAREAEVNRQRVAMGYAPRTGSAEPIGDIASRLKKDADSLVALATRYQEMLAEKDTELAARSSELLNSESLRKSLFADNNRLRTDLNQALNSSFDAERLRAELQSLKSQRDALYTELELLREKMKTMSSGASAEDYADLMRRYEESNRAKEFFEARVKELESDLTKAKLFASSENELLPAAVELFRSLRLLEGKPDSEIATSYSSLGVKLGANVMKTLSFATGSSALNTADDQAIREIVDEVPDGDLVLAIGYASETGNEDSNRTLSSDRATAAAQLISSIKRPGQFTQAVYLGQTDRFSSRIPERNQIVEIWHIRKK